MTPARWPRSVLHRIALLAMLLPFLAVSALPAGYMPGHSDTGALTLVLCTADGPQEMVLDLGGGPLVPPAEKACPWALAHAAWVMPVAHAALTAPVTLVAVKVAPRIPAFRPTSRPERAAARAPPALA